MKTWISIPVVTLLLAWPCAGAEICCSPPDHPDSPCLQGLAFNASTGRCETAVSMTADGPKCPGGYRAEASQQPLRGSIPWKKSFVRCVQAPSP